MINKKSVKTNYDVSSISDFTRLYGAFIFKRLYSGRVYMPLEYMHYYTDYCGVIRVNYGGTLRVVVIYDNGSYYNKYNLPCAILFGEII